MGYNRDINYKGVTMTVGVDTLSIYERLQKVHMDEKQAKEISLLLKENAEQIMKEQEDTLITKSDLKKDLAIIKAEMIQWIAGMLIAQAAIVATLVKIL